jgi:hypothetical protein
VSDGTGFPAVDLGTAETVFEPPGNGEGYWVGAPCVHRYDGTTYLAIRWRTPERRGHAVELYEWTGEGGYDEVARITASELGVESVERVALVTDPVTDALKLYVPADRGENDWCVLKLDDAPGPAGFDPETASPVLTPAAGTTDEETVKDPVVLTVGSLFYMFYAGHDGTSEQAHLARSTDGEDWIRVDGNPILARGGWHDHHTRVSCVVPAPDVPAWFVLYDGSGSDDYGATWNLRTGLAVSRDLARFVDATPDRPLLGAPGAGEVVPLDQFGTCRYLDALPTDEGLTLFAEVARPDGAFELVRFVTPWPGDSGPNRGSLQFR